MKISPLKALADPKLFGNFLGSDQSTWWRWKAALAALFGLPLSAKELEALFEITGRKTFHPAGYNTALFLTGRRSGKSRVSAFTASALACLSGAEEKLAPGEQGIVPILAPTRLQGSIVWEYVKAAFSTSPILSGEVADTTADCLTLKNGIKIMVCVGDHAKIRGFTAIAAIVDEACFFATSEEARVKSDTALIESGIKPALGTTEGKCVIISTPYSKSGWCYKTCEKCYGNESSTTLVVRAPSKVMNPTLSQAIIDEALASDLAVARSEFFAEWREDLAAFISEELVRSLVAKDRQELLPRRGIQFAGGVDLAGGRGDDCALCISHIQGRTVVVDLLRRWRPPCDPRQAIREMARILRDYNVRRVTGDNYAADFVARAFNDEGIHYQRPEKNLSALLVDLLPRLCSGKGEIELLDHPALVAQLSSLERRVRPGGRDVIGAPPGGHDDLCAALACCVSASAPKRRVGPMFSALGDGERGERRFITHV